MNILLHTIALEPARWAPKRVSQDLRQLLPEIARAGFTALEVFEPHLADPATSDSLCEQLRFHGISIQVLSSYFDLGKATDSEMDAVAERYLAQAEFFGFQKVRLFSGSGLSPHDADGVAAFEARLQWLADRLPSLELLIETHDGSIADDPATIVELVERIGAKNLGLLFQPTLFDAEASLAQFELQKHLIRHVHLQNRDPANGFATLQAGVVPWPQILTALPESVAASIEFVPTGIVPEDRFDLETVLAETVAERAWVDDLFDR